MAPSFHYYTPSLAWAHGVAKTVCVTRMRRTSCLPLLAAAWEE